MDFETAATKELKNKINRISSYKEPQEEFLFANINEFMNSKKRDQMLIAAKYYENENDILDRKRYYIDRKGIKREATNLTNATLPHPFFRKLVNQKINYLLSKEPSFQTKNDKWAEVLGLYLNKAFLKMLKNVGKDAIIKSIAWIQVYYDKNGKLCFKRIPTEEIIPFWADADHTVLDAFIRYYSITEYLPDGVKKEIIKVEYYTPEGVWYYVLGDRGLLPDLDRGQDQLGHFMIQQETVDGEGNSVVDEQGNQVFENVQAVWEKVPIIGFKYNSDEVGLLKLVKPLVDDYDVNASDTSNNLQDVPNSIKVVKNYDGADKEEFVQNLATYRTVFVAGDGDMTSVETKLDVAAIDSHLNRLRKDIYEAGSGVDTQELSLGNASGVALSFRYADLDIDTDDMASEFVAALEQLMWFIKVDAYNKGLGDFFKEEVEIIFNTDSIINENEIIGEAKASVGIISDETILANHPWVTDVKEELDRLKVQKEEQLKDLDATLQVENQAFGLDNEGDKGGKDGDK